MSPLRCSRPRQGSAQTMHRMLQSDGPTMVTFGERERLQRVRNVRIGRGQVAAVCALLTA